MIQFKHLLPVTFGLDCLTLILKLAINPSVSVSYIRRHRTRKNSGSHPESALLEQLSCLSEVQTVLMGPAPLLTSSCVKLWTWPLTEIFSMPPFLLIWSLPEGGSLVRIYLSLRLSESTSVPFRFCSVIFEEVPEVIQNIHETIVACLTSSSHFSPPSHLLGAAAPCWRSSGVLHSWWRPWWTPDGLCRWRCHPWGWRPFHLRPRWQFQVCRPAAGPGRPGRWRWSPASAPGRSPAAESRTDVGGVSLRWRERGRES